MLFKMNNFILQISRLNKKKYVVFLSSLAPQEKIIRVGDHYINYLKVGNGSHHLLCMPGALGTIWTHFKPQVEGIDKDKFTMVVWEPPGYGKSRPPEKVFTEDLYEKDAHTAFQLMKALNIPKYSLLGWSGGGITSLFHAAKYPEVIRKMVVWGVYSLMLPGDLENYRKLRDIKSWSKAMKEPMVGFYGEEQFANYWARWTDGMINLFNENNGNICSELLKDIKCPTFILYGEKDHMIDKVHLTHLHTHIIDSRIHLYPEGKHNIHMKYADDFNRRVQEFLLHP